MMTGSVMPSDYTDGMTKTLASIIAGAALLTACTIPRPLTTSATVEVLEGNQHLVSVDIQPGGNTLASPKVLCLVGETATIELSDAHESISIGVQPPAKGVSGPVLIDLTLRNHGKQHLTIATAGS
jgi:hypothetical protein